MYINGLYRPTDLVLCPDHVINNMAARGVAPTVAKPPLADVTVD